MKKERRDFPRWNSMVDMIKARQQAETGGERDGNARICREDSRGTFKSGSLH